MNYDEHDSGAPAVDWQESQDEAVSCAQMERDEDDEAYTVLNSMTGCADDLDTYAAIDILPVMNDGDSLYRTAMPDRISLR